MKTSLENKSKILKLVNKQKKLKFWNKKGDWILMANAFVSLIPFSIFTGINLGLSLTLISVFYTVSSIVALCVNFSTKDKILKKIGAIDQEILDLVKKDQEEFTILREYHNVKDLQNKLDKQKSLLKQLIEKKYNKKSKKEKEVTDFVETDNDLLV